MFARLFNRFRKHSFDLDNPTIVKTGILTEGDKEFMFTKFHSTRCDKTLALDKWQMKELPRSMSHGCNPQGDN